MCASGWFYYTNLYRDLCVEYLYQKFWRKKHKKYLVIVCVEISAVTTAHYVRLKCKHV